MQVTCVLTSCGRFDLLERTLRSFFKVNSYHVEKFIIIDDSGCINANAVIQRMVDQLKIYKPPEFLIFCNEKNIGQVMSIHYAYSCVETEYIFHMEDDWEFYADGFFEESFQILLEHPWIITVWLRAHNDTNGHPIEKVNDLEFPLLTLNYMNAWHGFTLNPGLRRTRDYEFASGEASSSKHYMRQGFRAAITKKEDGYVRHIGWDYSTAHMAGTSKA
jgi:hypothetical protein